MIWWDNASFKLVVIVVVQIIVEKNTIRLLALGFYGEKAFTEHWGANIIVQMADNLMLLLALRKLVLP